MTEKEILKQLENIAKSEYNVAKLKAWFNKLLYNINKGK